MNQRIVSCFPIAAVAIAFTISTRAADYTWGGGNGNWSDINWNPGPVTGPTAGTDTATINSGAVDLNVGGMNVGTLTLGAGGTFNAYNWNGTNTYTAYNDLILQGGTISGLGNYHNWGAGILKNTTVSGSAPSTISASSFFNLDGTGASSSAFDVPDVTLDATADLTVSATLADVSVDTSWNPAALVKSGGGTMSLTAANWYSGGTTVDQGTLLLDGGSGGVARIRDALTVNSGATVTFANDDGTGLGWDWNKVTSLTINGGIVSSPGTVHVWNLTGGVNMTGGTLQSNNGASDPNGPQLEWNWASVTTNASEDTATIGGRIRMRTDGGYPGITFNVADGAALTDLLVSAAITEASAGLGITKQGDGTMVLSGANSYTGTTTVAGGTLVLSGASSGTGDTHVDAGTLSLTNPVLNDGAAVVIASGATLDLDFSGNDIVGGIEIDGTPLDPGTYNKDDAIYSSYFTGDGSLIILGGADGTWTSLTDGNWGDAANWDANTIANGSDRTATFNADTGVTVTVASNRTIGKLAFDISDYMLAGAATLTLDTSVDTPVIDVATGRTATIAANLGGIWGMEKTGDGTLVLTGVKSYTGGTTVTGGMLELSGATGGNGQIHGSLIVNPGTTVAITGGDGTGFGWNNPVNSIIIDNGTINASGSSHLGFGSYASLTLDNGSSLQGQWQWNGDGLLAFSSYGESTNTISGSLTLRADAGTAHTFYVDDGAAATDLQIDANLSDQWPDIDWVPASGLTKTGAGTIVLAGTNTYDGNTVVNDGALEVTAAGSLHFRPTTNGATNSVSGSSTASLSFLGTVDLDLGAADTTADNAWTLFDLASFSGPAPVLTPTAVTSDLGAFAEVTPGVWELEVTDAKWIFTTATGSLAYTVTATDYDTWADPFGLVGGPNDDDDNDGLTNFDEYAFGLIPTSGASVNPIPAPLDQTAGTFSYTRRTQSLTGLTYTIRSSTTLAADEWTVLVKDTDYTESVSAAGDVETVTITLTPPPTAATLFVQVSAN